MGKRERQLLKSRTSLLLGAALLALPAAAQVPGGGQIVSGAASIVNSDARNQQITQRSDKAIINWRDFSIGADSSVRFSQPSAASVVLNRVIGADPSAILGNLSANGQVFLVNPNGIYFGAGARLDVGGLVASSLNIRDEHFLAGRYVFRRIDGMRRAEVVNAGVLKARDNGYVVLAGDYAANRGVIEARLGTVLLGSANQLTLDIVGDSLVSYALNKRSVIELAGVANSGQLMADGGRVVMTAATARSLSASAVNNSGVIQARGIEERDGAVYLLADAAGITLDASSRIDVSGERGGGKVLVGGGFQGTGSEPHASSIDVAEGSIINADAGQQGNGGQVVLWSDGATRFAGQISARGGNQGGDGGSVEVSGHQLNFAGTVDTLAAAGRTGTLLLDPADITITSNADADIGGSPSFTDATNNGGVSNLSVTSLQNALGSSNVSVSTATASGSNTGTITVSNGVSWTSGNTLSFVSNGLITFNAAVNGGTNGGIKINSAGGATQNSSGVLTANTLELLGSGSFNLTGASNSIGTLAANVNGALSFKDASALIIGTAGATTGINTSGNGLKLDVGGNLTQQSNANLSVGSLELIGRSGSDNLSNTGNSIGGVAASTQGDFTLGNSSSDLFVQVVGGTTGISTANHNFTLNDSGTLWLGNGAISGVINAGSGTVNLTVHQLLQYGNAALTADKLGVSTDYYVGLSGSFNSVNTLAVNTTGGGRGSTAVSFDIVNGRALTIGTVGSLSGLTTQNTHAKVAAAGNITLANNISTGTGHIALFAKNGSSYYAIDAGHKTINSYGLGLQGSSVSNLDTANVTSVKLLAADLKSSFGFTAANELTIGNVFSLLGITTTGDLYLKTGTFGASGSLPAYSATAPFSDFQDPTTNKYRAGLMIDEGITASGRKVYIDSASGVFQWATDNATSTTRDNAKIIANALLVTGQGQFDFSLGQNEISHVSANVNGNFTLADSIPLAVDHQTFSAAGGSADITGVQTRADTIVSGSVAGGDATYNQHNILLASSDDPNSSSANAITIAENITADSKGSAVINLSVGASDTHSDALVSTTSSAIVQGSTLVLGASADKGSFNLKTNVTTFAAAGGKSMLVDNTAQTGRLTILGIGTAQGGSPTPVGDFFLSTGGDLLLLGGKSTGNYLQLRANKLDVLGGMDLKDGERVLLQPLDMSRTIGIHNSNDPSGFTAQTNYSRGLFQQFTQTATFYLGSTPALMNQDSTVPTQVKNLVATGDIHIASDGDGGLNFGYRSLSAETSGSIVAQALGSLYNLRLSAPTVTAYGFNVTGDQIHIISSNYSMPSAASAYKVASNTDITLRGTLNRTIWVGYQGNSQEPAFSFALLNKFPDGSNLIISGTTDQPLIADSSSICSGCADIHMAKNGQASLGNRKLTLSTTRNVFGYDTNGDQKTFYDHLLIGSYTESDWNGNNYPKLTLVRSSLLNADGTQGKSGGTWGGCASLASCQATNPSSSTTGGTTTVTPGSSTSGSGGSCSGSGCTSTTPVAPAPAAGPSSDPTSNTVNNAISTGGSGIGGGSTGTSSTGGGTGGTGSGSGGSSFSSDPNSGMSNGGPSGGGGTSGGGSSFGGSTGGSGGSGSGSGGSSGGGSSSGSSGSGSGSFGGGSGGAGSGSGGSGSGSGSTGSSGSGSGSGSGSSSGSGSGGSGGAGSGGSGGSGSGSGSSGASGSGSSSGGSDGADLGGGSGSGSGGSGSSGAGNGGGGSGSGSGSGGAGSGSGGSGSGGAGSGSGGSGGAGGLDSGSGGGSGSGSGGASGGGSGSGSGAGSGGSGSGGAGSGGAGSGSGSGFDSGAGDAGSGSGGGSGGGGAGGAGSGGSGSSGAGNGGGDSGAGGGFGGAGGSGGGSGGSGSGSGGSSGAGGSGDGGSGSGGSGSGSDGSSGGSGSGGAGDSGSGAGGGSGQGGNAGGGASGSGGSGSGSGDGAGSGGAGESGSGLGAGSGKGGNAGGGESGGGSGSGGSKGAGGSGGDGSGVGEGGGSGGAGESGSGATAGSGKGGNAGGSESGGDGSGSQGSGGGDQDQNASSGRGEHADEAQAESAMSGGDGSAGSDRGGNAGGGGDAATSASTEGECLGEQNTDKGRDLPEQGGSLADRPLVEVRGGGVNLDSGCNRQSKNAGAVSMTGKGK